MQKFICTARLSREVEVFNGTSTVAKFGIAVQRKFKKDGEPDADFFNCVAFGKLAEVCEKYLAKGNKVGIVGRFQTGSYTNKDGQKVYTTDLVIEDLEFLESKSNSDSGTSKPSPSSASGDGFMNIQDGIDESLPFN